jgi:hypothetical protein
MVVYHGTDKDFNVFDSASGEYWFSEYEDYAESMAEERGGGEVKAVYLNVRNPYRAKLPPGQFSDPSYEAKILQAAKTARHDGVIIENDTTDPLAAETFYVVFNPNQIKSATDNIGTFNPDNPDIRYLVDDAEYETGKEQQPGGNAEAEEKGSSLTPEDLKDVPWYEPGMTGKSIGPEQIPRKIDSAKDAMQAADALRDARQDRERPFNVAKEEFVGTDHLQALGVKVANSVGDNWGIAQNNQYKVHRVILPGGLTFYISKTKMKQILPRLGE